MVQEQRQKVDYINVYDPTAPTAEFSADITAATVSEVISFTDLSTGVPDGWDWDFGDGATSTDQNPTHVYLLQEVTLLP